MDASLRRGVSPARIISTPARRSSGSLAGVHLEGQAGDGQERQDGSEPLIVMHHDISPLGRRLGRKKNVIRVGNPILIPIRDLESKRNPPLHSLFDLGDIHERIVAPAVDLVKMRVFADSAADWMLDGVQNGAVADQTGDSAWNCRPRIGALGVLSHFSSTPA